MNDNQCKRLFTKCEVKMAGYWLRIFLCVSTKTKSRAKIC